jgi:hypothetical protein
MKLIVFIFLLFNKIYSWQFHIKDYNFQIDNLLSTSGK